MNEGRIRILITQDCMYNCFFCHKEGVIEKKEKKLEKEDIVFLYKVYNKHFKKDEIRLSGGEPLERNDIEDIVKSLYQAGCKVLVTTNGYLLKQKKSICKYIKRLNISIHSLNKKKYANIVNSKVDINAIISSVSDIRKEYPELDIVIDVTLLKGINTEEEDIEEFLTLAKEMNVKIKFVELFLKNKEYLYELSKVEKILENNSFQEKSKYIRKTEYIKDDNIVYLAKCFCNLQCENMKKGLFCNKYNDLFITSDGKIRICRLKNVEIDIINELKEKNEKKLIAKLEEAYSLLGNKCLSEEKQIWK